MRLNSTGGRRVSDGDLHITATPARHFSARTPFDRNRALWGGFMLTSPQGQVFFAGDSGAGSHWREIRTRLGAPDVALLPIGAYEPRWFMAPVHMNPAEAVEAHLALEAGRSVGMHFGTFQLTDEAIDAPQEALTVALAAAGVAPSGVHHTRVWRDGALPVRRPSGTKRRHARRANSVGRVISPVRRQACRRTWRFCAHSRQPSRAVEEPAWPL